MKTGKIIQVLGPVVDVEFENQNCLQSEMLSKYKMEIKNV